MLGWWSDALTDVSDGECCKVTLLERSQDGIPVLDITLLCLLEKRGPLFLVPYRYVILNVLLHLLRPP
jgi:hypothetical protein